MDNFEKWWRSMTKQGDPDRRPNLVEEAFLAGEVAGLRRAAEIADECGKYDSWPNELRRGAVETKFVIEHEAEKLEGEGGG